MAAAHLLLAVGLAEEPFAVSFDQTLNTAAGQPPVETHSITFAAGKSGQAGVFGLDARLAYPTAGAYDPRQGTVEMWVQRQRDDSEEPADRIFWLIQSDAGESNLAYLGFRGTDSGGQVYFANPGGADAARAPVEWPRGAWRHLLACWDETVGVRALYIDGEFQAAHPYTRKMPGAQPAFHVGYSPNTGRGAMAVLDEFKLHKTVVPQDFLEQVKMTEAHVAAHARRAETAKHLRETYSFDRVQKEQIEVHWKDLLGLPTAFTQRVPIQACYHPEVVMVHPDLSISLGRQNDSFALGFALGDEGTLPDMHQVTRGIRHDYQPIVTSRWNHGPLVLEQTAFCILPDADAVATGRERQLLVVRMTVENAGEQPVESALLVMIGKALGAQRTNYRPFVPVVQRWREETFPWQAKDRSLVAGDRVLLAHRADGPEPAAFHPTFELSADARQSPESYRNCLRFPLKLKPGETRTIDLVAAGTSSLYPETDSEDMASVGFEAALRRAENHWDRLLAPGMKLTTPDPRINTVYKAMIVSSLQNLHKAPDRPWHEPDQSCFHLAGVWPWEFSQQAVPLASIGYHRELEGAIQFFTERQVGVGPHAATNGPQGDVASIEGCYVGNCGIYWMCETGAILNAMAGKYRYSRGAAWLEANRSSILAAWRFIENARKQTRITDENGQKHIAYGLLPAGRATDGGERDYMVGFSDNYTWEGMAAMAEAFRVAGLSEAEQMIRDADDYRECILEAVRRSQYEDPDTGLLVIPNSLTRRGAAHGGKAFDIRYSLAMWQTGLLDATDPRFDAAMEWQQRRGGFLMGLVFPFPIGSTIWYVNSIEKGKYMNHLARGELEKSLLVFYTNLIYSMSQDCFQTVERIDLDEPNFSPFQQNASGNGRIIEMCRRMVIDEQEPDVLWLLRGCPRRWFAPGKTIAVDNAPTRFGPMALRTQSDGRTVAVEVEGPSWESPRELRVAVRHPDRLPVARATANGRPCEVDGETVIVKAPVQGRIRMVCEFGQPQ
jgi:hypothetical protein